MTDARLIVAHIANALSSYAKRARIDGFDVPVEVDALAALLVEAVSSRHGSSAGDHAPSRDDARPVIEPELLTRSDVAGALRVSLSTVDRLLASGALPSVDLAGPRVRRSDLDRYVEELPVRDSISSKGAGAAPARATAAACAAAVPSSTAGTGPRSHATIQEVSR